MKKTTNKTLVSLFLLMLICGLVNATDDQSTSSSSSSSSTNASTTSSSSSSSSSSTSDTSSSSSRQSSSSSTIYASTSSSQVSSSSSSSSSMPTMYRMVDQVVSLLPKIGDLLTGVGDNLIWPVVYILIILGIAGIILALFSMVVGIVAAVVLSVSKFSHRLGGHK